MRARLRGEKTTHSLIYVMMDHYQVGRCVCTLRENLPCPFSRVRIFNMADNDNMIRVSRVIGES